MKIKTTAMRMQKGVICLLAITSFIALGCVYVKKDLPSTVCNPPATVSYSTDIAPILQSNCYTCHSVSSNITGILLDNYIELNQYVPTGRLLGSINHASGFIAMPDGAAKLDDCTIEIIKKWIANGAPNN